MSNENTNRPDDQVAEYVFQTIHSSILADIVNGKEDATMLAAKQLASRGLDKNGNWVGFDKADEIHGLTEKPKTVRDKIKALPNDVANELEDAYYKLDEGLNKLREVFDENPGFEQELGVLCKIKLAFDELDEYGKVL